MKLKEGKRKQKGCAKNNYYPSLQCDFRSLYNKGLCRHSRGYKEAHKDKLKSYVKALLTEQKTVLILQKEERTQDLVIQLKLIAKKPTPFVYFPLTAIFAKSQDTSDRIV